MEPLLDQRKGFARRRYLIEDDGVRVEHRSPLRTENMRVPYTTMQGEPFHYQQRSVGWAVALGVAATLSVVTGLDWLLGGDSAATAWLFWGVLAAGFGAMLAHTQERGVVIPAAGPTLWLWTAAEDDPEVAEAVRAIVAARRTYYRRLLMSDVVSPGIDPYLHLSDLLERGVLTEADYLALRDDLMARTLVHGPDIADA